MTSRIAAYGPGAPSRRISKEQTKCDEDLMATLGMNQCVALDILLCRYWESIVAYAEKYVPNTDAAEDVAQETFVRLWESRESWRSTGSVRSFLYRVARNLALNEERSRRIHSRRSDQIAEAHGSQIRIRTPAERLEERERRRLLDEAIATLPRRRRQILRLAKLRGLSYQEVAQLLDISQQTVANQMSAALSALRKTFLR